MKTWAKELEVYEELIPEKWEFGWVLSVFLDAIVAASCAFLVFLLANLFFPYPMLFVVGFALGTFTARLRPLVTYWTRRFSRAFVSWLLEVVKSEVCLG